MLWPITSIAVIALLVRFVWPSLGPHGMPLYSPAPPAYAVRTPDGQVLHSDPDAESWDALSRALATPGAAVLECHIAWSPRWWPDRLEWELADTTRISPSIVSGSWSRDEVGDAIEHARRHFGLDQRYSAGAIVTTTLVDWVRIAAHAVLLPLVPTILAWPFVTIRIARRCTRVLRGACPACGYDVRDLDRCPECGSCGAG